MLVGVLQTPPSIDVESRIACCEQLVLREEFDLLALPAAWSIWLPECCHPPAIQEAASHADRFSKYLCDLSARKHATIVAGAIEAVEDRLYQTAIIASLGALQGRYVKKCLSNAESRIFSSGKLLYVSRDGHLYSFGVISDSDLRCRQSFAPLGIPRVNFGIVVGGSCVGNFAADLVRHRAMHYGTTLVYANVCGSADQEKYQRFGGQSGIVSSRGTWLARATDVVGFLSCEMPDQVRRRSDAHCIRCRSDAFSIYGEECGFSAPPAAAWL